MNPHYIILIKSKCVKKEESKLCQHFYGGVYCPFKTYTTTQKFGVSKNKRKKFYYFYSANMHYVDQMWQYRHICMSNELCSNLSINQIIN